MQNQKSGNNLAYPECGIEVRDSIDELLQRLEKIDIVSFDVFDTLLLRAVKNPKDLFVLVGNRLGIPQFYDIRIEAEIDARKLIGKKNNHEVTIYDIYDLISERCNIKKEVGIYKEIEAEFDICFANPYFKIVYDELIKKKKTVVAISNMYLPKEILLRLLNSCGFYFSASNIYVSCDYRCSKRRGDLFKAVEKDFGVGKEYLHIGDNYESDFIGARMAGWKSYYYKGVNEIGNKYRPANMSQLGGSIYSGLVNSRLHNGIEQYDKYYELGYTYGGILVCGYCEWINEFAKTNDLDCLLFSGRDMFSVHKIYNDYFKKYENHYIAISRFAAQRFSFECFSEYFISTHIKARARINKLSIAQVFEELELEFLCEYLDDYGLKEENLFTMNEFENIKKLMRDKKSIIVKRLEEERTAAVAYYGDFVKNKKRIAIIDLGWQGTNALSLKWLIENYIDSDIKVYSLLLCATGNLNRFIGHSLTAGITHAFCASEQKSPQLLYQFQHPRAGRFLLEMIFTSNEKSLKRFEINKDDKLIIKKYMETNEYRNEKAIDNIIRGMQAYVYDYMQLGIKESELKMSGWECLLPINKLSYNENYTKSLLADTEVNPWIGNTISKSASDINKIIR